MLRFLFSPLLPKPVPSGIPVRFGLAGTMGRFVKFQLGYASAVEGFSDERVPFPQDVKA